MRDFLQIRAILAEECPGLARDCLDGAAGAERYRAAGSAFVARRYPHCLLAFAYGSAARGRPDSCSDLDLYVVAEGHPAGVVLDLCEGLPIEARVLSPGAVDDLLGRGADCRPAVFLARALEDAVWAAGSEALLHTLRERALAWLARCPAETDFDRIMAHRLRITNRLMDLARARPCGYRRLKAIFEMAESIRVLSNAERSLFQGRNLLEHLRLVWPERADALEKAIREALGGNDASALARLAVETLAPFGGLLLERVRGRAALDGCA